MYLALYRKYRPKNFEDVISQEHITTTLRNEVKASQISHAFLFTGVRGTGKTTCARILAKAVNCLEQKDGEPCCECANCIGIENDSILDVIEIDAASMGGVDNIRELREEAVFTPAVCAYRVYIIDEVHMLSTGAWAALLKIMEEPPSHVIFILATTESHKIPVTILSRCQRFDFRPIKPDDIAGRLLAIAKNEGVSLSDDAAMLIARLADGAMRDAISVLDQCIAFDENVTVDVVVSASGVTGRQYIFKLAEYMLSKNVTAALGELDSLYRSSKDFDRLCAELISHFRNMMIIKTNGGTDSGINALPDEIAELKALSDNYELGAIIYCLTLVCNCLDKLAKTSLKRIELEMCVIRICSPELDNTPDSLIKRIEDLERLIKQGGASCTVSERTPDTTISEADVADIAENAITAEPVAVPDIAPPPPSSKADKINFANVLKELKKKHPAVYGLLLEASMDMKDDRIEIKSNNFFMTNLIKSDQYRIPLLQALSLHAGQGVPVSVNGNPMGSTNPPASGKAPDTPPQPSKPESSKLDRLTDKLESLGLM